MSNVVQIVPPISDEESTVEVDDTELQNAAMTTFNEMVDGGCSLRDSVLAVYIAGMERITGAKKIKRKPRKPSIPPCPYVAIVESYHHHLPNFLGAREMDAKRKKLLRDFWAFVFTSKRSDKTPRATTPAEAIAWIGTYFARAAQNTFLNGEQQRSAQYKEWVPDIDYIVSPRGVKQVIERTRIASS